MQKQGCRVRSNHLPLQRPQVNASPSQPQAGRVGTSPPAVCTSRSPFPNPNKNYRDSAETRNEHSLMQACCWAPGAASPLCFATATCSGARLAVPSKCAYGTYLLGRGAQGVCRATFPEPSGCSLYCNFSRKPSVCSSNRCLPGERVGGQNGRTVNAWC